MRKRLLKLISSALIMIAFVSSSVFAQTLEYDFNGNNNGWNKLNMEKENLSDSWRLIVKDPPSAYYGISADSASLSHFDITEHTMMAITLKNNIPEALSLSVQFYRSDKDKILSFNYMPKISTGDADFRTYFIPLDWKSTDRPDSVFKVQFRQFDGSAIAPTVSTDVLIDKIVIGAVDSVPMVEQYVYSFEEDGYSDGWSIAGSWIGTIDSISHGVLSFSPNVDKTTAYKKLELIHHYVDGNKCTRVKIKLKNLSVDNDTLVFVSSAGKAFVEMSTNDTEFKTYDILLDTMSLWNNKVTDIKFYFNKDSINAAAGTILIDDIEFYDTNAGSECTEITTTPLTTAIIDKAYNYQVSTTTCDDSDVTFSMTSNPEASWLSIDATTGLVTGTPTEAGDVNIVIYAAGATDTASQVYTLSVSTGSSIDALLNNQISVFPNPATDVLNISGANGSTMVVYSITGSVVMTKTISSDNDVIDVSGLQKGMYFISVNNGDTVETKRVIIE